jgi:hypothetical protein
MKVAYLVDCYPWVSHTFIRREIAALEGQGVEVDRFSVRRPHRQLVDEEDKRELVRTRVILDVGILHLLFALPVTSPCALWLRLGHYASRSRLAGAPTVPARPRLVMEAFALGRPALTIYVGGVTELMSSECGWLVPAGSLDDLTAAMRQALDTPLDEIERMGREGQRRVREQHSAAIEAKKLHALFGQAIAASQP